MQIIENTTEFYLDGRSAVAIGKFDGVHLGHRSLLERILERKGEGLLSTIFTFDSSAASFFGGEEKELTIREEKRAVFEKLGVDVLIEFPLNEETASTLPETFIRRYLSEQMHAAYLCAGKDISFGRGGRGNAALLEQLSDSCGYRIELIDKVRIGGEEVSSTRIRKAVREGRMELAGEMLGVPYSVSGCVTHGRRLGSRLGMPTANLALQKDKLLPPFGVYYSRVWIEDKEYRAITNIGCKPTVSSEKSTGAESFLYDFEGDLYGKDIRVELLAFRRRELHFESVEQLQRQMQKDIEAGRGYMQHSGVKNHAEAKGMNCEISVN